MQLLRISTLRNLAHTSRTWNERTLSLGSKSNKSSQSNQL